MDGSTVPGRVPEKRARGHAAAMGGGGPAPGKRAAFGEVAAPISAGPEAYYGYYPSYAAPPASKVDTGGAGSEAGAGQVDARGLVSAARAPVHSAAPAPAPSPSMAYHGMQYANAPWGVPLHGSGGAAGVGWPPVGAGTHGNFEGAPPSAAPPAPGAGPAGAAGHGAMTSLAYGFSSARGTGPAHGAAGYRDGPGAGGGGFDWGGVGDEGDAHGADSATAKSRGGGRRSSSSADSGGGRRRQHKKREYLSNDVVVRLMQWLLSSDHFGFPYPDAAERAALAAECGMTGTSQIVTWFTNARKRLWLPSLKQFGIARPYVHDGPMALRADTNPAVEAARQHVLRVARTRLGMHVTPDPPGRSIGDTGGFPGAATPGGASAAPPHAGASASAGKGAGGGSGYHGATPLSAPAAAMHTGASAAPQPSWYPPAALPSGGGYAAPPLPPPSYAASMPGAAGAGGSAGAGPPPHGYSVPAGGAGVTGGPFPGAGYPMTGTMGMPPMGMGMGMGMGMPLMPGAMPHMGMPHMGMSMPHMGMGTAGVSAPGAMTGTAAIGVPASGAGMGWPAPGSGGGMPAMTATPAGGPPPHSAADAAAHGVWYGAPAGHAAVPASATAASTAATPASQAPLPQFGQWWTGGAAATATTTGLAAGGAADATSWSVSTAPASAAPAAHALAASAADAAAWARAAPGGAPGTPTFALAGAAGSPAASGAATAAATAALPALNGHDKSSVMLPALRQGVAPDGPGPSAVASPATTAAGATAVTAP